MPGTGPDDVANIDIVGSWWILKELPLQKRPRGSGIGDAVPSQLFRGGRLAFAHSLQYVANIPRCPMVPQPMGRDRRTLFQYLVLEPASTTLSET
ncbi:MAG: hypothetical protein H6Q31_2638 [Bacteroidetes bacterium]|nr:hypothetical protein [Bacteroidota bacterium]